MVINSQTAYYEVFNTSAIKVAAELVQAFTIRFHFFSAG
jgi:hypothetical protein